MSKQEREDFLGGLHVGVLAVERPDGPPLVTPVWYRYRAGDVIEFNQEALKNALDKANNNTNFVVPFGSIPAPIFA